MCTVFHIYKTNETNVIGKNYDIKGNCPISVFINQKCVPKTAIIKPPDVPARWESQWGNVTFNAVGAEFPVCGMNEEGLVVEQTTLWNALYPDRDDRQAIKELQWIQMMLDTCSSVQDVLDRQRQVRIAQEQSRLQFVVADKSGERALIEHTQGDCIVHSEPGQPSFVIANDMLQTSKDYLATHQGYEGTKKITRTKISLDRFVVTKDALKKKSRVEKRYRIVLMYSNSAGLRIQNGKSSMTRDI
jgi:choloylglycine hydrolase